MCICIPLAKQATNGTVGVKKVNFLNLAKFPIFSRIFQIKGLSFKFFLSLCDYAETIPFQFSVCVFFFFFSFVFFFSLSCSLSFFFFENGRNT